MEESQVINYVQNFPRKRVKIAIADIDGILRGKYISRETFLSALSDKLSFCGAIFESDLKTIANSESNDNGEDTIFHDELLKIDIQTFRKIPWENDTPFFMCELEDSVDYVCPRGLLRQVVNMAESMGLFPYFSQEIEWSNSSVPPSEILKRNQRAPASPGSKSFAYSLFQNGFSQEYYDDLFELINRFNIPIEAIHVEDGLGVLEISTRYLRAMDAADCAALLKMSVKQIARNHGLTASFMAKLYENSPGCGGHVHQSIWDRDKKHNLFYEQTAPYGMSSIFRHYVAGQLYCMPYILPIFAPTVNSYKRLKADSSAPTRVTWGIDNRLTALRVLSRNEPSTRLETRVPGADVNPYLVMAACLASGIYGIKHKLLPPPDTRGNGHKDFGRHSLPSNLFSAIEAMKKSSIATELFGEKFTRHFIRTREWEWLSYQNSITDWEIDRYYDRI
jgi:glutamine synthetase